MPPESKGRQPWLGFFRIPRRGPRCPALLGRMPHERIPRAVQDLSARGTNGHHRRHDCSIKGGGRESREEPAVDGNRAHLGVVTTQVNHIRPDYRLEATPRPLDPSRRLGEADERFRVEGEPGESETIQGEAIAWDIVPFGVRLKGRPARLLDRRCRGPFSFGGRGRTRAQHDRKAYRAGPSEE